MSLEWVSKERVSEMDDKRVESTVERVLEKWSDKGKPARAGK